MVEGIVFDLDGTLTRPHAIDFARIRARIGMPGLGSILHWIAAESRDAEERELRHAVVVDEESRALERMELNAGFDALAAALRAARSARGTRAAICTRNSADALRAFDALLHREGHGGLAALFCTWHARGHRSPSQGRVLEDKPHPDPAHEAVRVWGLEARFPEVDRAPEEGPLYEGLHFVGDSADDLMTGRRAGFSTCLVSNCEPVASHASRYACRIVDDLRGVAALVEHAAAQPRE